MNIYILKRVFCKVSFYWLLWKLRSKENSCLSFGVCHDLKQVAGFFLVPSIIQLKARLMLVRAQLISLHTSSLEWSPQTDLRLWRKGLHSIWTAYARLIWSHVKIDHVPRIPMCEIHVWRHTRAPLGGGWLLVENRSLLAPLQASCYGAPGLQARDMPVGLRTSPWRAAGAAGKWGVETRRMHLMAC